MEYIKQGIRVEKETVFEWIRQLSKQLEQYYRCGNEDAAYGYVNPYAVIITGDGMLCLLDINEPENEELLKQMKKKNIKIKTKNIKIKNCWRFLKVYLGNPTVNNK